MKPVLIIQNSEIVGGGTLVDYLKDRNRDYLWVKSYAEEDFPAIDNISAVINLGATNSISDIYQTEHLMALHRFVATIVRNDLPYLGICFGAQLLAHVLGANVEKNPQPELGSYDISLTDAGLEDPVFSGFERLLSSFEFHGDTFKLPHGSELLATGTTCAHQAFRFGKAVGLQFHPESVPAEIALWCDNSPNELAALNKSKHDIVGECEATAGELKIHNYRILDNFFASI